MTKPFLRILEATAGLAAALPLSIYLYGRYYEANKIVVERKTLPVANLPEELDGFKIVQMSDFHVWPHTQMPFVQRVVDAANALQPDLIALTGDYLCRDSSAMNVLAPVLGQLRAPQGVFSVLGNHDIFDVGSDVPERLELVCSTLAGEGIPTLRNQHARLDNGLVIAGLDEMYNCRPDLTRALTGVGEDEPVVLLVHQPDFADYACKDKRIILQLSGHTHGGQIRIPWIRPIYLPWYGKKYTIGLYQVEDMWVYVTRGVGMAMMAPLRFRCPPEITEITLKSKSE